MGAPREYSKAVHEKTGSWGTFPPDLPIRVGDIIQLEGDGKMMQLDNVLNWPGWRAALPIDEQPVTSITTWSHEAAKSRMASAQGGATTAVGAGAKAEVKISFSAVGGFVLEFVAGKYHKFRSVITAQNWVLGLYKNGQWKKDHALITQITEASPAAVLMSSASNTSVVLSAKASLPAEIGGINIADPQFGFEVTSSDKDVWHTMSKVAFPMYHCVRIGKKWWGGHFAELQGAVPPNIDEIFVSTPFDEDV